MDAIGIWLIITRKTQKVRRIWAKGTRCHFWWELLWLDKGLKNSSILSSSQIHFWPGQTTVLPRNLRKKKKTKKETTVENIVCWISPNLHIKLKQIQGRGKYSDVIWSDFFVWYEAIENAQGQFKEQARWVSCIKMGMKNNPENAIYCKNCWHA